MGEPLTIEHCGGGSMRFDGYASAEVYELAEYEDGYSPLDLADTPLTMQAWVKRGPQGRFQSGRAPKEFDAAP